MVLYYNIKQPEPEPVPVPVPVPEPVPEPIQKISAPIMHYAYSHYRVFQDILNNIFHSDSEMYYDFIGDNFNDLSTDDKLSIIYRQNITNKKFIATIKMHILILMLMLAIIIFKLCT
mgnify:CR=1 FL=1